MNETSSTLVAHCGARKVTREELLEIPVPEGTRTHQPLARVRHRAVRKGQRRPGVRLALRAPRRGHQLS